MSSAGINPLALIAPDLYAKQIAIQRRQALASSLLGDQMNSSQAGQGNAGLANAGNRILGAFLARGADKDLANLYAPQQSAQPADIGQISNTPVQPTTPLPQPGEGIQQVAPQQPAMRPNQAQPPQQAMGQALMGSQSQQPPQGQPNSISQAMNGAIPDLPGMTHEQSMLAYFQSPQAYFTALAAAKAPTPDMKNAAAAYPNDPIAQQQAVSGIVNKGGSIEVRPEGFIRLPNGQIVYGPNESSNTYYTTGPNNEPVAHVIAGGADAAAQNAGAIENAKELNKIIPDVPLSTGARVPMMGQQAIGGQPSIEQQPTPAPAGLNINANNPINMQPGGQEARYATPTAGFGTAWDNLEKYGQQGINTVSKIVKTWAPQAPPDYAASVAQKLKVDQNQPLDLTNPNVKGLLIDAMQPNETGTKYAQAAPPQIGVSTAQAKVNDATGDAAVANAKTQATAQATLAAIDGLISLNDKTPDSTGISPEWKADLNRRVPGIFQGDAGNLAQWNQLSGINVLGGLKTLQGLGRLDLPEVNQVVKTNGVSPDVPRAQRLQILQNLKTAIQNNLGVAQSNVANLNQPGITGQTQTVPMQNYGVPSAQDIVNELRRRGAVK